MKLLENNIDRLIQQLDAEYNNVISDLQRGSDDPALSINRSDLRISIGKLRVLLDEIIYLSEID